ncbi:MAG: peptidoglycan DD-metalloendopeptidase family protein [Patescibacteria group bacterium]
MIAIIVIFILSTFVAVTAKTRAQESGSWEKLNIPKPFYTLEVTPYGIYAGEFNSNWNWNPYNGVFVSHDLGESWAQSGLKDRGVTDIAYGDGVLYVTIYYWGIEDPPGLYRSIDKGASWKKIGPDFSSASVAVCGDNIILGGYSHGLWLSQDGGDTWVQKLGDGWYGGDITSISVSNNIAVTSDYYNNYISNDCGVNWDVLGKNVSGYLSSVSINNNIWLACSGTTGGIYRSTDYGGTFYPVEGWSPNPCYAVTYYNSVFYASSHSNQTSYYNILESLDKGLTWQDITPNDNINNYVHNLSWLASSPGFIFATSPGTGLYRYKVPPYVPKTQPFISKLWSRNKMSEQTDTITSYFDHSYPLLAYPYKSEPAKESDTTTNFWGDREKAPKLYYSNHDGVDFGLKYGRSILAPASGYASYSYTTGGGYTIKIDHQNGYQTQYLHLQKEGLFVTVKDKDAKWIDKGQQVGLVGLTGNTTGPHLHFGVRHDKNNNGNFLDDVPDGRVDPYAWQDDTKEDPWEVYSWTDALGDHAGSESAYLWEDFLEVNSVYLSKDGGSLAGENAIVTIPENTLDKEITLSIQKTGSSNVELANKVFKYVHGTALLIKAYDNVKNQIYQFTNDLEITFDLSQANFSNIATETLKIMYFDPGDMIWNQVPTIWHEAERRLTGIVNHLSEFAVFGEKIDANPPDTTINITGQKDGDWYTESPMFSLIAVDRENESGVDKIFYSLDGGGSWEEYLTQTQVVKEGIYAILFRSVDKAENYEPTKDSPLLRVDTLSRFKDEVILPDGSFTIAPLFN